MNMRTPDIDLVAAMMSRGATLDPACPWTRGTDRVHFALVQVPEVALHEYRTGSPTFSISAFTSCRRFLMDVVKTSQ